MRNAEEDLRICDAATSEPWTIAKRTDDNINPESIGHDTLNSRTAIVMCPKYGKDMNWDNDALFIITSREALPYWINRAVKLEKEISLLRKATADVIYAPGYTAKQGTAIGKLSMVFNDLFSASKEG